MRPLSKWPIVKIIAAELMIDYTSHPLSEKDLYKISPFMLKIEAGLVLVIILQLNE